MVFPTIAAAPESLSGGWKVQLQMGDPGAGTPGLYDIGLYDVDVYGSDEPTAYLLDVTGRCMQLVTERGRRKFTGRFRTGKVRLTLVNDDGAFTGGDPPLGVLALRPGRSIRISYNDAGVFFGFVDTMSDVHGPDGSVRLQVTGYDAFSQFNVNDLIAVPDEGGGDSTFFRYRRLLDHFLGEGEYALRRLTQQGSIQWETVQATTMGQNLLAELQITADSEGGGAWIGVEGTVTASQRDYFTDRALEPVNWVVGGTSPIGVMEVGNERTMQRIVSQAHMARVGGVEQIAINSAAVGLFGRRTHTRLDLINDQDNSVAELAQRLVDFAGVDRLRLTELTFLPLPGSDAALFCSAADFGDVVLATVNTLQGWDNTFLTQIFGIGHDVTSEVWLCTMFVDDSVFAPSTEAYDVNAYDSGFS